MAAIYIGQHTYTLHLILSNFISFFKFLLRLSLLFILCEAENSGIKGRLQRLKLMRHGNCALLKCRLHIPSFYCSHFILSFIFRYTGKKDVNTTSAKLVFKAWQSVRENFTFNGFESEREMTPV